jgi:hypothetical protein
MENKYLPEEYRLSYERVYKLTPDMTLNQYKRTDVMTQLFANLRKNNSHMAMMWAAELHMSSQFDALFTRLIHYFLCERNASSPHILSLIAEFMMFYIRHIDDCPTISKRMREATYGKAVTWANDQKIRNFLGALVAGIATSTPGRIQRLPVVTSLDMTQHRGTLMTHSLTRIKTIVRDDDPTEIIVPLSEIQCILGREDIRKRPVATEFMTKAVYWLGWLVANEKAQGKQYHCLARPIWQGCTKRHYREWVKQSMASKEDVNKHWSCLVWEIIFATAGLSDEIKEIIADLYHIWVVMMYRGKRRLGLDIIITAMRYIINPLPFIEMDAIRMTRDENWRATIKAALSVNFIYADVLANRPELGIVRADDNEFGYE